MSARVPLGSLRRVFLPLVAVCYLGELLLPHNLSMPILAATISDQFVVSTSVVASCTVSLTPSLIAEVMTGGGSPSIPCTEPTGGSLILAPAPLSLIRRDPQTGLPVLTLMF